MLCHPIRKQPSPVLKQPDLNSLTDGLMGTITLVSFLHEEPARGRFSANLAVERFCLIKKIGQIDFVAENGKNKLMETICPLPHLVMNTSCFWPGKHPPSRTQRKGLPAFPALDIYQLISLELLTWCVMPTKKKQTS